MRIESRVERCQILKASDEQSRGDDQRERQPDVNDNERMANPIAGYSGESAAVVRRSSFEEEVTWPGRIRISGLATPVKIHVRFEGRQTSSIRLYALYLGE